MLKLNVHEWVTTDYEKKKHYSRVLLTHNREIRKVQIGNINLQVKDKKAWLCDVWNIWKKRKENAIKR